MLERADGGMSSLCGRYVCSETIPGVDWDDLGFGLSKTDFMYVMKCEREADWQKGEVLPYGNLDISPSAAVLNYGQVCVFLRLR